MKIKLRQDAVEISGYVNAIERKSKPIMSRMGQFVERICKGAFRKAIARNDNIRLLLNHDWEQELGNTKDGTLELAEDNIGLHARATITNPIIIEKARAGDLIGWSFGFRDRDIENKRDENGYPLREVKDLDLEEVSILDRTRIPAYDGTLVSVRAEGQSIYYGTCFREEEEQVRHEKEEKQNEIEKETQDYSKYEKIIEELKIDYSKYENLIRDLKFDNMEVDKKR